MRLTRTLALTIVYTVASLTVLSVFIVRPGLTGHPGADFPAQVAGTADRPYAGRILVPATIRAVRAIIPDAIERRLATSLEDRRMVGILSWQREHLADYAIALAVLLGYLVAFAFVLRALAARFCALPPVLVNLSPLIGLLFIPLFFSYFSYLYDPGTLLTFALAVLALTTDRFVWVIGALALAALNKETSILLIPVYAVHEKFESGTWRVGRVLALVLVWGAVRGAIVAAVSGHPGATLEHHVDHTAWLFREWPLRFLIALGIGVVIGLFVGHRWRAKSPFLRAGLGLTLLPLVVAALWFGFADELRGYYECYPFLYLLALPSIYELFGFDPASS